MSAWPGFTTDPCGDCAHPGDHHQPPCVATVDRAGRGEYCGCPHYRCQIATQTALFADAGAR